MSYVKSIRIDMQCPIASEYARVSPCEGKREEETKSQKRDWVGLTGGGLHRDIMLRGGNKMGTSLLTGVANKFDVAPEPPDIDKARLSFWKTFFHPCPNIPLDSELQL